MSITFPAPTLTDATVVDANPIYETVARFQQRPQDLRDALIELAQLPDEVGPDLRPFVDFALPLLAGLMVGSDVDRVKIRDLQEVLDQNRALTNDPYGEANRLGMSVHEAEDRYESDIDTFLNRIVR